MTWADDGHLYTAYGDGNGFEPGIPEKLSLGFARIEGGPADFAGVNIRSASGEQSGDGKAGKKASGIAHGRRRPLHVGTQRRQCPAGLVERSCAATWEWSDWTFTTSFGCPTFLNFGRNYAGARDDYVYVYSHDNGDAYLPADRMVLARVPRGRIKDRSAYEFFAGSRRDEQAGLDRRHRPPRCRLHARGQVLPVRNQLRRGPEAVPLVPGPARRRPAVSRRVWHL